MNTFRHLSMASRGHAARTRNVARHGSKRSERDDSTRAIFPCPSSRILWWWASWRVRLAFLHIASPMVPGEPAFVTPRRPRTTSLTYYTEWVLCTTGLPLPRSVSSLSAPASVASRPVPIFASVRARCRAPFAHPVRSVYLPQPHRRSSSHRRELGPPATPRAPRAAASIGTSSRRSP